MDSPYWRMKNKRRQMSSLTLYKNSDYVKVGFERVSKIEFESTNNVNHDN